jgi:hypothetical protein
LNKIIYTTIRDDVAFQGLTGATTKDPRVYKGRTPVKIRIGDATPGYCVYYLAGTTDPGNKIYPMQLDNHSYMIEVYGKNDVLVDGISSAINTLFKDEQFVLENVSIKHSDSSKGGMNWDDNRSLYFQTVRINLDTILDDDV